jgi:hypothetical protein
VKEDQMQNVQVFIKSEELGAANPSVIAYYPTDRAVPKNTHGEGMSVYVLPSEAIKQPSYGGGGPTLVDNWQNYLPVSLTSEAALRIEGTFPLSEQVASLHQTIEYMQKYGADPSKWPLDARQQEAALDPKWDYVDAVNESAKKYATARPYDLSSDKVWPTPPPKK